VRRQAICIWEELSDARWRTKLVVAIAVFVDTAATLVVCAQVWIVQGQLIAIPSFALPPPPTVNSNTTLPGLGNSTLGPPALDRSQVTIQWTYPTIIATTGITGFIVHAYLLHRIYTLYVLRVHVAGCERRSHGWIELATMLSYCPSPSPRLLR
jgi:hypothetical protein